MKYQSSIRKEQGTALIMTLILLGVVLLIFGSMFYWVNTNAVVTVRNNQYNMSETAAESAVERVIGQIDRDFINGSISNSASMYAALPTTIDQGSWPMQYIFSSTNGSTGTVDVIFAAQSSSVVPLNSQYSGLSGKVQNVDVYATATPVGQQYNVPATVHEALQFANIPLYQFAIFYNVNLEIMSAAALNIYGPVFCNQSIWEGSTLTTFYSTVTAAGTNAPQVSDPFANNYSGSGASTFLVSGQPVSKADPLTMPIGTNNSPGAVISLLDLPPAAYSMGTSAAYSSNGMMYPANAADLVVTNFASGTNWANGPQGTNMIIYYQDYGLSQVPYDFYVVTNANLHTSFVTNFISATLLGVNTNIYYATFSWITNIVFYDWREGWNSGSGPAKTVQAVQIDMVLLNKWLTNTLNANTIVTSGYNSDQTKVLHSGHHIGSVYVYSSVPLTTSVLPAVRAYNGAQLPNPGGSTYGFTVATKFPMYVLGNYNTQSNGYSALGLYGTNNSTGYTLPASLMADSVTILSTNWSDAISATKAIGGPIAGSTTINAAMLEGIVPSNPAISGNYSGGVENFMRLLENWSSKILTYNGSIVVLFYSQYATNSWQQTGNYYTAATRHWAFDLNFQNSSKLPPLTPASRAMVRGNWYAHQ